MSFHVDKGKEYPKRLVSYRTPQLNISKREQATFRVPSQNLDRVKGFIFNIIRNFCIIKIAYPCEGEFSICGSFTDIST